MELVVITAEPIQPNEAVVLNLLFAAGLGRLHLRKPGASEDEVRALLEGLEPQYRGHIVLHDHFGLVREFGLAGVHLNRRNPEPPEFPVRHLSRSCHSLAEVAAGVGSAEVSEWGPDTRVLQNAQTAFDAEWLEVAQKRWEYDYVFLSPIFDSISKSGYGQAFTQAELLAAKDAGIVNERVYALGGVDENNIKDVARMGFGGVAILGSLWQEYLKNYDRTSLLDRFRKLKTAEEI